MSYNANCNVFSSGNKKGFWQTKHIKKRSLVIEQHSEIFQQEYQTELPTNEMYDQGNAVREPDSAPDKQPLKNTPSGNP